MDPTVDQTNGTMSTTDSQPTAPDLLGDLLGPLAIEGPPGAAPSEQSAVSGGDVPSAADAAAIVPVEEQTNLVQVFT